jgi:FkbM family methyltransferase
MNTCIFLNDDNCNILLLEHSTSEEFKKRDNHEIIFRRVNTYLIKNNIIKNNIIDLGAWIGDNSIPWSKNINGVVYAIDPSNNNCEFIKQTCELNNIKNVKVIQTAISDKNEVLTTNNDVGHCSFVYSNPDNNASNKVKAVSLDYLYQNLEIDNIGYIHLDVEGMEYRVILGSLNIIDIFRPVISFEQHLEIDDYGLILSLLKQKDYKVFLIDEVLPGCRADCRNSIAFPSEIFSESIIDGIKNYLNLNILIEK